MTKEKRTVLFAAILLLHAVCIPPAPEGAAYGPRYASSLALVVGIDRYPLWPHLEYAAKDAGEVAAVLKEKGFKVTLLTDGGATRAGILNALARIGKKALPDSRVVFYFAGHGQTEDLPGGREQGYLVPADADAYDWTGTMLAMGEVNRIVRGMAAKHVLLAFDSCYSGLGLSRSVRVVGRQPAGYVGKMMRLRSIQVITAGGRSEQAVEAEGHGLFTDHLLAALSGAADLNADGYTTVTEIYATIRPSVTRRSFNRQTPLFGYIEGEGDMVFAGTEVRGATAAVVVDNRVGGIDLWAGTSEIGRRLPVGRHRLEVQSGMVTLLVKKGGRTLFHRKVKLLPGGEITVHIDANRPGPAVERRSMSMLTIARPGIRNYGGTRALDMDGDGLEEFITASDRTVQVLKSDGSVLWQKPFDYPVGVTWCGRFDGYPVVAVSGKAGNMLHLAILGADGALVWHHRRAITRFYQGKPDGGGGIVLVEDLDGDGRDEIVARTSAGYAWKPRGFIVYDRAEREMWRYLIGPSPGDPAAWRKPDGTADLVFGSYSPGNGNREDHNRTDDMNAYVFSIDARGRTNWAVRAGGHFTGTAVVLADLDGNGEKELYARKYTAYNYRKDEGAVFELTRNGQVAGVHETADSIQSLAASAAGPGRSGYLYATDKQGNLYKLDRRLRIRHRKNLNTESEPLEIRLAGVHDYDGDGSEDVLMYSFNRRQIGNNPRSDRGPKNKVFYANMSYRILSGDLEKTIRKVSIAEKWDQWRGFKVADLDRPEMRLYPFMALSDKITVFNY